MRSPRLLFAAAVLLLVGIAGLVLLGTGVIGPARTGATPAARGQQIFDTGTDPATGRSIPRTGGISGGMMGGRMMAGAGCAACHGPSGQGRTTPLFSAPNISYANLTDPRGMLEPDGSRGPTYTDAEIARAVTTGIDAEGKPLDQTMPHWQLTQQEVTDLLAYLKTLS